LGGKDVIDYLYRHPERIWDPFFQHITLVLTVLALSVAIAAALTVLSVKKPALGRGLNHLFSVIYSIPSLALFAVLIPVTGLGTRTAVIVLTAYNQYLLLRNFLTGLDEVDPAVIEAAFGMGMTDMQTLWRIRIPLARRALFAGVRLAVVSTIGIGTIAASINAGGLGTLLFDGLRTMNVAKILWGSLLSAGLAIAINGLLKLAENRIASAGKEGG